MWLLTSESWRPWGTHREVSIPCEGDAVQGGWTCGSEQGESAQLVNTEKAATERLCVSCEVGFGEVKM